MRSLSSSAFLDSCVELLMLALWLLLEGLREDDTSSYFSRCSSFCWREEFSRSRCMTSADIFWHLLAISSVVDASALSLRVFSSSFLLAAVSSSILFRSKATSLSRCCYFSEDLSGCVFLRKGSELFWSSWQIFLSRMHSANSFMLSYFSRMFDSSRSSSLFSLYTHRLELTVRSTAFLLSFRCIYSSSRRMSICVATCGALHYDSLRNFRWESSSRNTGQS